MKKVNVTIQTPLRDFMDGDRLKFLDFTRGQFEAIKKRNLQLPVKLYQL